MQKSWMEHIKKLTSIDSTPFAGVADVCAFYAELCEQWSIPYRFVREGEAILINPLEDPVSVVHNSLETKEPGPHSFWDKTNYNPFEAKLSSGRLYGLGVASSKSNLLWQIYALKNSLDKGEKTQVSFFGGSFSKMEEDLSSEELKYFISKETAFLVSRPTSSRVLTGICGKVKIRLCIPLEDKEKELKKSHFHQEDTATQSKIFRGISSHGSLGAKKKENNALTKLTEYLKMLPLGVLVLNMEAGHSTDQVPAEAMLELNLSQPVEESVAPKFLKLMGLLSKMDKELMELASEKSSSLPVMNIGKLRHTDEMIYVDLAVYLSPNFDFEKLKSQMQLISKKCEALSLSYEYRQELGLLEFRRQNELLSRVASCHRELGINYTEGQSVIESVARKLTDRGVPCIQFGLGVGLGNIDEPNEVIGVDNIEKSIGWFEHFLGSCQ